MALFDIDKSGDDRAAPMPNAHDVLNVGSVMAKQTISTSYSVGQTLQARLQLLNAVLNGYNGQGNLTLQLTPNGLTLSTGVNGSTQGLSITNNQILLNDGSFNRVLIGQHVTLGPGLFVSNTGNDATTATGDNLAFNSNQNVFKIVAVGNGTCPAVSGSWTSPNFTQKSATNSSAHGLSYIPFVLAFYVDGFGGYTPLPCTDTGASDFTNSTLSIVVRKINVDATNVNFVTRCIAGGSASSGSFSIGTASVKYFLLQETAN